MKLLASLVLAANVALATEADKDNFTDLKFVFEAVRHGARAPFIEPYISMFGIGSGILTSQGMRQRYLLGRYNRERYTEQYPLYNPDFTLGEIYIQSTDVLRTLQSGYSQMMGAYPPGSGNLELTENDVKSLNEGRGMPTFNVRDAQAINDELGQDAVGNGFVSIPEPTFMNVDLHDDIWTQGCPYSMSATSDRTSNNANFIDYWYTLPFVTPPLQTALQFDESEMDGAHLTTVNDWADAWICLMFEGLPMPGPNTFDDNTYMQMRNVQKIKLDGMFGATARTLYMTKFFRRPLKELRHRVSCLTKNACADFDGEEPSNLKYLIYSNHDDQMLNIAHYLQPNNLQVDWVDFSTNMQIELFADPDCLAEGGAQDESCFGVNARFNGEEMAFDGCQGWLGKLNQTGCTYTDFMNYMDLIAFDQAGYDSLDDACMEPYNRHAMIGHLPN